MIQSKVALHTSTENYFFGWGTIGQLMGNESFAGLTALAIRGVRPSDDERAVIDAIASALCAADPRIWPLKMARLVSSYGGIAAGLSAGILACDNPMLGPLVSQSSAQTLVMLRERIADGVDDEEFVAHVMKEFMDGKPHVKGLGIPLREFDERYVGFVSWMDSKGFNGVYWKLHLALGKAALEKSNTKTNIVLGTSAALLDCGYSPDEIAAMMLCLIQTSFIANVFEGSKQKAAELQKLPDDCVEYVGKSERPSPLLPKARL